MFAISTLAQAHGLATAKTAIVNGYLLEFEYDRLGDVPANEFMLYNVDIIDIATNEAFVFDRAYIRIRNAANETVLVSDVFPNSLIGGIIGGRIGGIISEPGDYKVDLVFYKDGQEVAGAVFDHKITPLLELKNSTTLNQTTVPLLGLVFLFGLMMGLIFRKLSKKIPNKPK